MENEVADRRVTAGFYKRFEDGHPIYVVDVLKGIETGRDYVVCKHAAIAGAESGYFIESKQSFCSKVVLCGKRYKKYVKAKERYRADGAFLKQLNADGYRAPIRHDEPKTAPKPRRSCSTYYEYAKDLCRRYSYDKALVDMNKRTKLLYGVTSAAELKAVTEDVLFVQACFWDFLGKYKELFREIFIEGKSIRKCAEHLGKSRGSIEYALKRMYAEFAAHLQERDRVEGHIKIKP